MNPIKPKAPTTPGWTETTYAEKQQDTYNALPVVRNFQDRQGPVISVWEPDADEIELLKLMLANGIGVRISLEMWTFRRPVSPVRLIVGHFPEPYQGGVTHHDQPLEIRVTTDEPNTTEVERKEE